jgi:GNAT superfamily N-acetyltransferase
VVDEVEIDVVPVESEEAQRCLRAYFAELDERFDIGFDVDAALPTGAGELVIARLQGEAVGCGALKVHPDRPPEIKRMWVDRSARGLGVGRRLLAELEDRARAAGAERIRLDTNGTLVEAIEMYRKAGYVEIPAYNDEPHATHWFERRL